MNSWNVNDFSAMALNKCGAFNEGSTLIWLRIRTFHMELREFSSLVTSNANTAVEKMAPRVEKANCVLWCQNSQLVTALQKRCMECGNRNKENLHLQVPQVSPHCTGKRVGKRPVTETKVNEGRAAFVYSPPNASKTSCLTDN